MKRNNLQGQVVKLETEKLHLENEIERLKDLCNKYEEEHRTTFEEWKKTINIINEFDRYIDEIIDERIEKIEGTRFLKGGFTTEQNYLRRRLHERLQELKGIDKQ